MKRLLPELDWNTPFTSINMCHHWRIWLGILVFSMLAAAVLDMFFPNTTPFLKLWTGFAIGSVPGTLFGVCWQFRNMARRSLTSGSFLLMAFLGWGSFAIISSILFVPQMRAEEAMRTEIRSLTSQNLTSIEVRKKTSRIVIVDGKIMDQFCKIAGDAELFYPSHEGSIGAYELSLFYRDNQVRTFRARIPERHPNDLSLDFRGPSHWTEIRLPGGKNWIASAMQHEKTAQQNSAGDTLMAATEE